MDIMPDKKQLRAGSTALRKHKPVPVMSSRPGVSVDYSCASCGTRFADLETAREHTVLRIVEAVSNTEGRRDEHQQTDQHGVQAPGHVHIVGRAGTCRANRSTRRSASIRDSTGGSARGPRRGA